MRDRPFDPPSAGRPPPKRGEADDGQMNAELDAAIRRLRGIRQSVATLWRRELARRAAEQPPEHVDPHETRRKLHG